MRIAVGLYLLALAVRLALVLLHPDPAYPDSAYYVEVARSIAAGRGLSVDFVWIFAEVGGRIPPDPALPIPSNGHWMPLASFVQVPFLLLLGPTAFASALPFALVGALAAPLAWAIGRDAGASPRVAIGAGVLTAIPALATVFMAQPDNFSLFQPIVAAALWGTARGLRGDGRAFALAGLLAGLATLARNDGLLVVGVIGLAALRDRVGARRLPTGAIALAVVLFLAVMAPWWARQLAVFGTLSPSTASGRALFIRTIEEWNSISGTPTLEYLLGQGLGPFLLGRLGGLVAGAWIYTIVVGGVVLVPFMVVGAWRRRRSADLGPYLAYAAVFFAFSGLVSAVHVPGGTFLHSAVALAPHGYLLALEGLVALVGAVAARRAHWELGRAERILVPGLVAIVAAAGLVYVPGVHATWSEALAEKRLVAETLDRVGAPLSDRLMTIDAASYRYATGRGGVVLVNDPLTTIERVAIAYDVRWLVLERRDAVPAVGPILDGPARPGWIGPPVLSRDSDGDGRADLAVHPVCTRAGDDRCAVLVAARR